MAAVISIGGAFGSAYNERLSAVGGVAVSLFTASFRLQSESNGTAHDDFPAMEGTNCTDVRCTPGGSVVQGDCDHGRLSVGVWRDADGHDGKCRLVPADSAVSHKRARNAGCVFSTQTLSISPVW